MLVRNFIGYLKTLHQVVLDLTFWQWYPLCDIINNGTRYLQCPRKCWRKRSWTTSPYHPEVWQRQKIIKTSQLLLIGNVLRTSCLRTPQCSYETPVSKKQVKVTLRLTVGQSVCPGVEPPLGLGHKYCKSLAWKRTQKCKFTSRVGAYCVTVSWLWIIRYKVLN
jgi:hypothetical protein